jgi:PKD domain
MTSPAIIVDAHTEHGVEPSLHPFEFIRASLRIRTIGLALVLGVCMVLLSSVQAASPAVVSSSTPLQSVDYRSSGREYCEGGRILRSCLLSLEAVVTGGTAPIHVKWYLSNGTRLKGDNTHFAIEYGAYIYGVCLRASDATGMTMVGGHWEYGINYWSNIYHTEKYAYIRVRAHISSPCSTIDQPVTFNGRLECSMNCAPPPIAPTWFFGDGTTSKNMLDVMHSYDKQGVYFARLMGTDSWGRTNYSLSAYPIVVLKTSEDPNGT